MTDKLTENMPSDKTKGNQPLSGKQKFLFGMLCWGIQSWGQAANFKANGYDQKHADARKAMCTGLAVYGLGITLFVLFLLLL